MPITGQPGERPPPASPAKLLGRGYQGAVYLVEEPGGAVIVKKAVGHGVARAARRAMLRREHAVYQLLGGIRGVPGCHGLRDGDELVLEFVDGRSLREMGRSYAGRDEFFAELLALIQAIHRAGVAHGDLKRKDNILVGRDGRPWLIDFGTAVSAPPGAGRLRRALFRQMCRVDLNAWFKLKYQGGQAEVDPGDLRYFDPTVPERVARVVRRAWRSATLRRLRRPRRG